MDENITQTLPRDFLPNLQLTGEQYYNIQHKATYNNYNSFKRHRCQILRNFVNFIKTASA